MPIVDPSNRIAAQAQWNNRFSSLHYKGEVPQDTNSSNFSKGFVTEVTELNYPEGSAVDINNFELMIDGSIRRRKGLLPETGGTTLAPDGSSTHFRYSGGFSYHNWTNAGDGNSYIVVKIGSYVHFFRDYDIDVLSNKLVSQWNIYLPTYATWLVGDTSLTSIISNTDIASAPVSFCSGRGDLIINGSFIDPIHVHVQGDKLTASKLRPYIRDFFGIKDSIPDTYAPKITTTPNEYTPEHNYNLRSRGWRDFILWNNAPWRYFDDNNAATGYPHDGSVGKGDSIYYWTVAAASEEGPTVPKHDRVPPKNVIPNKLFEKPDGTFQSFLDATNAFKSQLFGTSSAPQGAIKNYLYDSRYATRDAQQTSDIIRNMFNIGFWSGAFVSGATINITIDTLKSHYLTTGQRIEITDNTYTYTNARDGSTSGGNSVVQRDSLDGFYTVTVVTWSTFTISYRCPVGFGAFVSHNENKGTVFAPFFCITTTKGPANIGLMNGGNVTTPRGLGGDDPNSADIGNATSVLPKSSGYAYPYRAARNAFWAGRLWQSGHYYNYSTDSSELYNDMIFFTKIILFDQSDYNKCLQNNDPTAGILNTTNDDDGGFIKINGIGKVTKMVNYLNSLLIFSSHGVWEITGPNGVFSPTNYIARKITGIGTLGGNPWPQGLNGGSYYWGQVYEEGVVNQIVAVENTVMYISRNGIYEIFYDQQQGYLASRSIMQDTIQTFWNTLSFTTVADSQLSYDPFLKRLTMTYGSQEVFGSDQFDKSLTLDLRLQAWFKYTFNTTGNKRFIGVVPAHFNTKADPYKSIKHFVISQYNVIDTNLNIADFSQSSFTEFTGVTSPVPDVTVAWDTLGDLARKRFIQYIQTFMRRTETGYTGSPILTPINESSLIMTVAWDYTNSSIANKWSPPQEVYRKINAFTPASPSDVADGRPVIIAKSKVRGVGKSVALKFTGNGDKDAHLLGWAVHYKAQRRI